MPNPKKNAPTFQELILKLQNFFAERGCVLQQPYDVEVGAGTMAPETFLRVCASPRHVRSPGFLASTGHDESAGT